VFEEDISVTDLFVIPCFKRTQTILVKIKYFIKRMNQIRWKEYPEENKDENARKTVHDCTVFRAK